MTRVPLAWRNLTFDKSRLVGALAGVMFAVVLMFMQLGYKNALFDSSCELMRRLNGDIFLVGSARDHLATPETLPRRRLYQALAHPDVTAAYPVYIRFAAEWKNPQSGKRLGIRVIGVDIDTPPFLDPVLNAELEKLRAVDTVLVDDKSRDRFGDAAVITETELARRSVRVVGRFSLGPDFSSDGTLITSDRTFLRLFPDEVPHKSQLASVAIGLLKLRTDVDAIDVGKQLNLQLPPDVVALSKAGVMAMERDYWSRQSLIGPIFNMGVAIGFVVGLLICYQILFNELAEQEPQFATLKAMGYDNRTLTQTVAKQAFFLSLVGFIPAVLCSHFLYMLLTVLTGLILRMTAVVVLVVFALTVLMCQISARIAVRRVLLADPADLFS